MFLENVTALTYDGDKAGYIIMGFDYWLLILFIVLVIAGVITFYMVFYERPTKETSYVRTGAGGEFVLMDRGGFVLPVIHEAIPVRMNTQKIEIHRNEEFALITKDRLRVDATAEFHLRVKADEKSISAAARTLGEKTLTPDLLKEQVEGLCVGALRSVAAEMDMDELHEKRREFEHNVERNISNVLLEMGLELVSVSMTALDQTALRFFDDSNALNVDGITYIQQKIAESQKRQNEVEQDKEVHIRRKEVEAREKKLQIEKEEAFFEQNQQREIAESEFKTELAIQKAKTAKEVEMMELDRKEKITKALAQRSVAKAWVETDKYKAQAASASEKIETSRKQAVAERAKLVETIDAAKEADRNRIIAEGSRDADLLEAQSAKERYKVEAEGKVAINKAANLLSSDQVSMQIKMEIVNQLPQIIRESAKPMENIDGINIMHVDGLTGGSARGGAGGTGGGGNGGGSGNLGEQIVDSALRYKAQAPLVDSLLKQIGVQGGSLKEMTQHLQDDLKIDDDKKSSALALDKISPQEKQQADDAKLNDHHSDENQAEKASEMAMAEATADAVDVHETAPTAENPTTSSDKG